MQGWGYALLCVLLPMTWGLVVVWAAGRVEELARRRRQAGTGNENGAAAADEDALSPEYHI